MPERNAHSYCTMIRGMAKVKSPFSAERYFLTCWNLTQRWFVFFVHCLIIYFSLFIFQHGASAKAYDMYTELLNERHKGKSLLLLVYGLLSSRNELLGMWIFLSWQWWLAQGYGPQLDHGSWMQTLYFSAAGVWPAHWKQICMRTSPETEPCCNKLLSLDDSCQLKWIILTFFSRCAHIQCPDRSSPVSEGQVPRKMGISQGKEVEGEEVGVWGLALHYWYKFAVVPKLIF